jgi:hypothetical protein
VFDIGTYNHNYLNKGTFLLGGIEHKIGLNQPNERKAAGVPVVTLAKVLNEPSGFLKWNSVNFVN